MNANIRKHIYTQKTVQLGTRVQTAKSSDTVGREKRWIPECVYKQNTYF